MSSPRRLILVVPDPAGRAELEGLARGGAGGVRLAGSFATYDEGFEAANRGGADVILVDLDADAVAGLSLISALTRSRPDLGLLPGSRSREMDLVLRAMRAGAREFLTMPVDAAGLGAAVSRAYEVISTSAAAGATTVTMPVPAALSEAPRIVALLGSSGGVGCTTLAVNLGATLAKDVTREVVLVDLDPVLGAVDACLDLVPDQTLSDVAQTVDRLDPVLLKRSLTKHSSGLYVLPAPATLEEAAAIDPESVRRLLERLARSFPTVILDLSKALHPADLAGMELAHSILLVVALEPTSLRNAVRLLDLFRAQCPEFIDKVAVLANRVGAQAGEIGAKKAEDLLQVPVRWQVPDETKSFFSARTRGVPLEQDAPGSRAHRAIQELARDFGLADGDRTRTRFGRIAASFF
jgi:pilus assembly protein CpaE